MQLDKPASSGNGYPAFKWNRIGDKLVGQITSEPNKVTTKAIDPGKPDTENIVFEVHTDEVVSCTNQRGEVTEGSDWTVWIRTNSQQYRALYDAVAGQNAKLTEGAKIAIALVAFEEVGKPQPMKVYEVAYKPGASVAAEAPSVADLLG